MAQSSDEDTFKILLATDIHLGYGEKIPSRENDTFITFEEILNIASKENVDFILLGGDLFHEAKPSPYCIHKCTELLKKYCLGDKSVEIEILSDPSINFVRNASVNYEDPNMNISIPVFSIHGNHDDPTGKKQISALDLIASMGLINYFGRWDNVEEVEINPILLKKGDSHLALYGLSHIRDERLARLFESKKVKFKVPENVNDWFNIFVLHQNRAKNRGVKNFIPETCIPEFVDLVMWGHEHDCLIEPTMLLTGKTYVTQPGSTVATSLSEGEAARKAVGLLKISGRDDFNLKKIELQSVRPFIFKMTALDAPPPVSDKDTIVEKAKKCIKKEIENILKETKTTFKSNRMQPLVRLIVNCQDERQMFNAIRFGQEFAEKVANPEDVIKFALATKKKRLSNGVELDIEDEEIDEQTIHRVEDLIPKYFDEKNKLSVLSIVGLNEAVSRSIDANDSEAPGFMIDNQEQYLLKKLEELQPDEKDIDSCLERLQSIRNANEYRDILNDPNRVKRTSARNLADQSFSSDDDVTTSKPTKGPGSRGGRVSRGGRGKAKGKAH